MAHATAGAVRPGAGALHGSGRKIRSSVKWNAIGIAASKTISLLAKIGLARLLVPEHFGFVTIVIVLIQIVKIAADLGLGHTLIQRKRDSKTRLLFDSAFWFLLGVAIALIALMYWLGIPLIVWFYGEPELALIATAMSASILLHNLRIVPEARLTRAMRFKSIALSDLLGAASGCVVAFTLALLGGGVWSLVAQALVCAGVALASIAISARWLPRLRFSLRLLREVKDFSSYSVGSRSLVYVQQNADYLLLGKLLGAYAVGIYAIAFLVTETLRSQIHFMVGKVVFPVYSRMLANEASVRAVYVGTIRYMTATMFPLSMLLILFAGDAIPALFTANWNGAVDPIRFLALASMVSASAGTPSEVLKGVGKPNIEFGVNLKVTLLIAIPALWIGIEVAGLRGAALAVLFHYLVSRVLFHRAIRKEIALTERDLLAALRPAVVGVVAMLACALLLDRAHWLLAAVTSLALYVAIVLPSVRAGLAGRAGTIVDPPAALDEILSTAPCGR